LWSRGGERLRSRAAWRLFCALTLALSATVGITPASGDQALSLDGEDDIAREAVGTASPSGLDLSRFTVEAWIFPTVAKTMTIVSDSAYVFRVRFSPSAANNGLGIELILFRKTPTGGFGNNSFVEFRDVRTNVWNHVSASFDSATNQCVLTINGRASVKSSCLGEGSLEVDFDQVLGIGTPDGGSATEDRPPAAGSSSFAGFISGVRISNSPRYSTNFTPECPIDDATTVGLWLFSDPPGSTSFADSSGGGRTLAGRNGAATQSVSPACSVQPATPLASFVTGFYLRVLGRTPADSEVQAWVNFLIANPTPAGARTMALGFLDGPEYLSRPVTLTSHVTLLYDVFLGRAPDAPGLAAWVGKLQDDFDTALPGFVNSPEFQSLLPNLQDRSAVGAVVTRLYQEVLGRTPAISEVAAWTEYIAATGDVLGVAQGFFGSAEYNGTARTLAQHVVILYRTFLGRDPAPAEVTPWVDYLQSFRTAVEDAFISSPEFQERFRRLFP
jgi:hypothetical protein